MSNSLNWNQLRPWNGSQPLAFEELCCQLAGAEDMPRGAKFVRKGTPDAGVECFWQFYDGSEHGWQAKFFLSPPNNSQWRQIDESVQKALDKHPKLFKYTVCLPIDRPDPRKENQKSCLDKWDERVEKWQNWVNEKGMNVEFEYWGQYEIGTRLAIDKHAGRRFFWFNEEYLSQEWFEKNLNIVLKDAGPRYTQELNVQLPISKVFDALGRVNEHKVELKQILGRIERGYTNTSSQTAIEHAKKDLEDLGNHLKRCMAGLRILSESPISVWEIDDAEDVCRKSLKSVNEVERKLRESRKNLKPEEHESRELGFSYELHYLRELEGTLYELWHLMRDPYFIVTNRPSLLVLGNAGTGKTHLFCDVANKRIMNNVPTVLLLGQYFVSGDPWGKMISQLGLPNPTTREILLGALEAAAQALGCRALIMIDALNESAENGKRWIDHLGGMLALLRNFPWVGIAISVRTSYQELVVPKDLVGNEFAVIEHTGFADCGYEAIKEFFGYYHIQLPSVPLLEPEFYNPLFLKIFCEGLHKKKEHNIPPGLKGVTSIFDFFLDAIDAKLARDHICYDSRLCLASKTAYKLAERIADSSKEWLSYEEADKLIRTIWPQETHSISPLKTLISEGLLSMDMFFAEGGSRTEGVKFCYQRFSDYAIASHLLQKFGDRQSFGRPNHANARQGMLSKLLRMTALKYCRYKVKRALKLKGTLGKYVKDEHSSWRNSGLIEALSVQIPELLGCELVNLAPRVSDYEYVQIAFVSSLVWRDPQYIDDKTLEYINSHIIHSDVHTQLLETLLTVAPLPYHPFNADFLHEHLMGQALAKRDFLWSTFLYNQYAEKGPVDRLIDWSWGEEEKEHISDDSIKLCAKTLSWFFTTSHRHLRDRATKALVVLLTQRIHILREIINDFQQVNDPYVLERIYAVAYGCAMRTKDKEALKKLALYVYHLIFEDGSPPPDISLRDYARGVIELALHYESELNVDIDKVRPPYKSEWMSYIAPIKEVQKKYEIPYRDKNSEPEIAQNILVHSVTGFADFARYIIGTNFGHSNWSSRRFGFPRAPTNREKHDSFFGSLDSTQKEAWDKYERVRKRVMYFSVRPAIPHKFSLGWGLSESSVFQRALGLAEQRFLGPLSDAQKTEFENVIKPFVEDSRLLHEKEYFDLSIAQAFILERVFTLGWDRNLLGQFDFNVDRYGPVSRTEHKHERLGKKYQWIAYRELLARVSDNFEFAGYITDKSGKYEGTWQISSVRDIDPSCILKKTGYEGWGTHTKKWWFPYDYSDWERPIDDVEWLKRTEELPNFGQMIEIEDTQSNNWIVLKGFYNMEQPTPPEEDKYELERRTMWFSIESYIVKLNTIDAIYAWAVKQDFWNNWMPESHDTDIFLGEFFWSPAFKYYDVPYYGLYGWTKGDAERRGIPGDVLVSTLRYSSHKSGYDCSINEDFGICIPAKELVHGMDLIWTGSGGDWCDTQNVLVAFDPSVREQGPGCALIRRDKLLAFLNEKEYGILWKIMGAKRMLGGSISGVRQFKGELKINGAATIKDQSLKCEMTYLFQDR